VGQLVNPWQAVIHARTGVVYTAPCLDKLAEVGFPVTPGQAGAIEAAADAQRRVIAQP
jgi:hypothetical protein